MSSTTTRVVEKSDLDDRQAITQDLVKNGLERIQSKWGWIVGSGVCLIVAGTATLAVPILSSLAVEFFIAGLMVIGGVAAVSAAFYARHWGGFLARLISGVLHVAVGVTMAVNPSAGLISLTALIAIFFAIDGGLRIVAACQSRKARNGWIWKLANGILTVACAAIIASQLPVSSLVLLGTLAGIHLIFSGWAHVILGLETRQLTHEPTQVN